MQQLKTIICRQVGRTMESPADFEYLSEQIQHATGDYLSPTTLKRLFGYIPQSGTPRPATLAILARFAGFTGWQDYLDKQHVESNFISAKRIQTKDLTAGQKINIAWNPDRECLIEYLGDNRFLVLHSQNSKLQTGDKFETTQMIIGQPLTATNVHVCRTNETNKTYVAGAKTGLTKIEKLNV